VQSIRNIQERERPWNPLPEVFYGTRGAMESGEIVGTAFGAAEEFRGKMALPRNGTLVKNRLADDGHAEARARPILRKL